MALFDVDVNFTLSTQITTEAESAEEAKAMIMNASNDEITHIQGKSYADISETTRQVSSVVEVID